jgi:hypothetical protein
VGEDESVGARILLDFDADAEKIHNEIIPMLSGPGRRPPGRDEPTVGHRPTTFARRRHEASIRVVGWLMFAAPLGVGIVIGWAIWGH